MLDIMRRQKRLKLILWFVILGLALGMLLFFVPGGNMGGDAIDSSAATIDGNSISMREYLSANRKAFYRLRNSGKNSMNAEALKSELPQRVLFELVSGKIRENLAKKFGIEVTPTEVQRAVKAYPAFQYQGQFVGVENYKATLAQNNLTASEFEEGIHQQLLEKKLHDILTDSLDVSDRDLREEFSHTNQKIQVDYVLLKKDEYKKRVQLTEAELKTYFETHKDQYRIMERRRAQFLMIPAGQFISGIAVSDKEIDAEWSKQSHSEIMEAAHILFTVSAGAKDADIKSKAEEILKRAKAGENFAALAAKYSDDKQSASKGGALPAFPRGGWMGKEFEEAAFASKPGAISGPVRTQYGYHIIKVLNRITPTKDSKRAELTLILQSRGAKAMAKQKAEEAMPLLEKQKDLNQVAAKLGVKTVIKETPLFMKTDPPSDFDLSEPMQNEVFELKDINSIGKAVMSLDGGYAIPKLIEVQLPQPSNFATSQSKIEKEYLESKAQDLLLANAKKLSEAATKLSSLEKAAREMGLSVKKSQEFNMTGTPDPEIGTNTPFNKAAFELEPGGVSAPQPTYNNMAVFQVKSRTPFDEAAYQKEKGELRNKLLQSLREPYFQNYIQKVTEELEKSGKIQINAKAVELALREN
jgi:peptidyl-prolyl cis-trans isomerase D